MRPYEMMILVNPDLEDPKEEISNVEEVVRGLGGEIAKTDIWGKRRLAYPIDKHTEGFYAVCNFKFDQVQLKELDRVLKLRSEVWRHMVVRLDEE